LATLEASNVVGGEKEQNGRDKENRNLNGLK
jgi:hypothetical protein